MPDVIASVLPLDDWQKRLEQHFSELHKLRHDRGLPVFALEHGLSFDERTAMAALLKERLRTGARLANHWLAWVVYAAEQGYDYVGEEFWATFEARTPLWAFRADRSSLRTWFGKFHTQFGGFKPTGPWATWFSIIAWPITHALLPKDLQQQLARALYQLRFQLAARINLSPAEIGRYISRLSGDASSRFRNFLQQEEIAGRIVLALLGVRADEAQQFILRSTLDRIVSDLEDARNARAWLRDARQVVERAQMKGAARVPLGMRAPLGQQRAAQPRAPQINPRLTLRRTGPCEWTPLLELPSFRTVADLHPDISEHLRRSRCSIAGAAGILPAGWLMSGDQRRVITAWPDPSVPVVKLELPNTLLNHLLQSDGRITAGPIWLFRIGPDGIAHEIVSRIVRPGKSYVLVSAALQADPNLASLSTPATLHCGGVHALALALPEQVAPGQMSALRAAGLSVGQSVRIWPAGLNARRWDGEGFGEWLEGETACFALQSDHQVSAFDVRLDGSSQVVLAPPTDGGPVFFAVPALSKGEHQLVVRAIPVQQDAGVSPAPAEGFVSVLVRSPQPWLPGTIGHSGLIATTEPAEPSLDQFWEGEVSLQVLGPAGHHVRICAELLDGAGDRLSTESIVDVTLPMNADTWERAVTSFLKREGDPWAYLSASAGSLLVDGDTLGTFRVRLHRDVSPVRWVWHRTAKTTSLRLVDEHEGDDELSLAFYSFSSPAAPRSLDAIKLATEWAPDDAGGLCVAAYGGRRQSLVVSMPQVQGGFAGLLIEPAIDLPPNEASILFLIETIEAWSTARLVGPLAAHRRERALEGLRTHLVRIVCGPDWATAEAAYARSPRGEADLRRLADRIGAPPAFAFVLSRDAVLFGSLASAEQLNHYAELAKRYGVGDRVACEAAFALCEAIKGDRRLKSGSSDSLLSAVKAYPSAMRGGRLIDVAKPVRITGAPNADRKSW